MKGASQYFLTGFFSTLLKKRVLRYLFMFALLQFEFGIRVLAFAKPGYMSWLPQVLLKSSFIQSRKFQQKTPLLKK